MNALAIAGFDPSGGGGLARDLATFAAFEVRGFGVVAALTAQNTKEVAAVEAVGTGLLRRQLETLLDDMRPSATKVGLLGSSGAVEVVADAAAAGHLGPLVVDPVLRSTSGDTLAASDLAAVLRDRLLPQTALLTPNLDEAAALTGEAVQDEAAMERAGKRLCELGAGAVLVKGGHLAGDPVDLLVTENGAERFSSPRIAVPAVRGTGCALSSAITAGLARGWPLRRAVEDARGWLRRALEAAGPVGEGAWLLGDVPPAM